MIYNDFPSSNTNPNLPVNLPEGQDVVVVVVGGGKVIVNHFGQL